MEIELSEQPIPLEKGPIKTSQRRFAKDEAILARFGKRQQLRVSHLIRATLPLLWQGIAYTGDCSC